MQITTTDMVKEHMNFDFNQFVISGESDIYNYILHNPWRLSWIYAKLSYIHLALSKMIYSMHIFTREKVIHKPFEGYGCKIV